MDSLLSIERRVNCEWRVQAEFQVTRRQVPMENGTIESPSHAYLTSTDREAWWCLIHQTLASRPGPRLRMTSPPPSQTGCTGLGLRCELHFGSNDDGVIERQSRHAHRRAGMLSDVGSIEFKDQVR